MQVTVRVQELFPIQSNVNIMTTKDQTQKKISIVLKIKSCCQHHRICLGNIMERNMNADVIVMCEELNCLHYIFHDLS